MMTGTWTARVRRGRAPLPALGVVLMLSWGGGNLTGSLAVISGTVDTTIAARCHRDQTEEQPGVAEPRRSGR